MRVSRGLATLRNVARGTAMSDDFVTGLRGDLVGAMDRYESRRPVARAATAVRGRRVPALRLAAVAAAAIVAVVFGVRHLPQAGAGAGASSRRW